VKDVWKTATKLNFCWDAELSIVSCKLNTYRRKLKLHL